jgi:alkaline phosphatase D
VATIAFGSDLEQDKPQRIWDAVLAAEPDVFIFAGDNVFVDSRDPAAYRRAYRALGQKDGFRAIRERAETLAIWDDHDLGENDAGADFPLKDVSKQAFLEFFGAPEDSARWSREGLYDTTVYGPAGRRVQIILLDTRYFRKPLKRKPPELPHGLDVYAPHDDPSTTLLGEAQWRWLEETLKQPADLRLIVSSIQVVPEDHRYESWSNFPHERKRLFDLIATTRAEGVILLSGDRNLAEISRFDEAPAYPVYEITSSPMTQLFPPTGGGWSEEPNRHRVSEGNFRHTNFGVVSVDWETRSASLEIRDARNAVVFRVAIPLAQLSARTLPVPFLIDGRTDEWTSELLVESDPIGDAPEGAPDITALYAGLSARHVVLRLDLAETIALQSENELTLVVDEDGDPSTGVPRHGLGIDWAWNFGRKQGVRYRGTTPTTLLHHEVGLVAAPTVWSSRFEMAWDVTSTRKLCFVIEEQGGDAVAPECLEPAARQWELPEPTLEKRHADDVRFVTWNGFEDGPFDPARRRLHQRILKALRPDVLALQEVFDHDAEDVLDFVQETFGADTPLRHAFSFPPDLVLVSRFPMPRHWEIEGASEGETNGAVLMEVSETRAWIVLIANPPCCEADDARQEEVDAMLAFLRARKGEGVRPTVVVGDMDFVGDPQQPLSLRTGQIMDEARFGLSFAPDWDGTELMDLVPAHLTSPRTDTYFDDEGPFLPGRLDYVLFSDSLLEARRAFVLSTPHLPQSVLERYGLSAEDTTEASDHLPVVVDFQAR